MACGGGRLCSSEKLFIFINVTFAMYSGALLATAARLAWDPSTYTWFRFLCAAQYHVTAAYVLASGAWLAALVYVAAAAAQVAPAPRPPKACLRMYIVGVVALVVSEVAYGAWMVASLLTWWRESPEAELARRGVDLLHDLKPALLAVERYKDVAQPIYDMIELLMKGIGKPFLLGLGVKVEEIDIEKEMVFWRHILAAGVGELEVTLQEVEHQAPNNVYLIIIFGLVGAVLQVMAIVVARRLTRTHMSALLPSSDLLEKGGVEGGGGGLAAGVVGVGAGAGEDGEGDAALAPGWGKHNLRMYTILDKIF